MDYFRENLKKLEGKGKKRKTPNQDPYHHVTVSLRLSCPLSYN